MRCGHGRGLGDGRCVGTSVCRQRRRRKGQPWIWSIRLLSSGAGGGLGRRGLVLGAGFVAIGTVGVRFGLLDALSRLVVAEVANISLDAPRARPLLQDNTG